MRKPSAEQPAENESFVGPARYSGGNDPTSDPHLCPYQLSGASKKVCEEFTTNYQRNLAGCCGTRDSRGFAPCNSALRRCTKCLSIGKGAKAGLVVDVARGLCEECVELAGNPQPVRKPAPRPVAAVSVQPPMRPPVKTVQIAPPVLPGADALKARFVEPKKPKPVEAAAVFQPPPQPEVDLDACAARYKKLTVRNKEIISALVANSRPQAARKVGMSVESLNARFSSLCSELGIPKADPKSGFSRQVALGKVVARHKETTGGDQAETDLEKERQMVELFRKQSPEEKDRVLNYMRALLP